MGKAEATSVLDPSGSTVVEPTPDRVEWIQEVRDSRKNDKEKVSPEKKKGWTPKAVVTLKFKGRIEELKGYVFDRNDLDQVKRLNWAIKDITKYVDQDLKPLVRKVLCCLNVPIICKPMRPEMSQGESTMYDVEKGIFQEKIR